MRHRKQIRLSGFDYSSAHAYFITICAKDFTHWFGEIHNQIMGLSAVGNIAAVCLQTITELRPDVVLNEFIIMPNHLHFILELENRNAGKASLVENSFGKPVSNSVSVIVGRYKGAVKKWCNENGYADFEWQSRFYDHVIRNDEAYHKIKNYIITNPACWQADRYCL